MRYHPASYNTVKIIKSTNVIINAKIAVIEEDILMKGASSIFLISLISTNFLPSLILKILFKLNDYLFTLR